MSSNTENHLPEGDDIETLDTGIDALDRPRGRPRHPFVAWVIASLRIMWSSLRHPGHPVWIDYRTGDVWLKRD